MIAAKLGLARRSRSELVAALGVIVIALGFPGLAASRDVAAQDQEILTNEHPSSKSVQAYDVASDAYKNDRLVDGLPLAEVAVQVARNELEIGPETAFGTERLVRGLQLLAGFRRILGDPDGAIAHHAEAIELQIAELPRDPAEAAQTSWVMRGIANTWIDVAGLHEEAGRLDQAEAAWLTMRKDLSPYFEPANNDRIYYESKFVEFLVRINKIKDARTVNFEAAMIAADDEKSHHWDSLYRQAIGLNLLAGDQDGAFGLIRKRQDTIIDLYGVDHPKAAGTALGHTKALEEAGRLNEAADFAFRLADHAMTKKESQEKPANTYNLHQISELARVLTRAERFAEAEPLYTSVLAMAHDILAGQDEWILPLYADYVFLLIEQERFVSADKLIDVLVEQYPSEDWLRSWRRKQWLRIAAKSKMLQGDYDAAEAIMINIEPKLQDRVGYEHALLMSKILNRAGAADEAETYGRKAVQIARRIYASYENQQLDSKEGLARILAGQGKVQEAVRLFDGIARSTGFSGMSPKWQRQFKLAYANTLLRVPGRETEAFDPAWNAFLDKLDLMGTAAKTDFFVNESASRDFEEVREAAMLVSDALQYAPEVDGRPSNLDVAFRIFQWSKVSELDTAITDSALRAAATRAGGTLAADIERRHQLYQLWLAKLATSLELVGKFDEDVILARQNAGLAMEKFDREREDIDARISAAFPALANQRLPKLIPINSAAEFLKPGEALLVIGSGPRASHSFAVSGDRQAWNVSDLTDSTIKSMISSIQWDLGAVGELTDDHDASWLDRPAAHYDRDSAFKLYRELIAPVEHVLRDSKKVFVISSGQMTALPLGVLVSEKPQGSNSNAQALRETAWLGDKYAFAVLPSLAALQYVREDGAAAAGVRFLGFGNPKLAKVPEAPTEQDADRQRERGASSFKQAQVIGLRGGVTMARPDELKKMASLPGTKLELAAMAGIFEAASHELFMQDEATEQRFKNSNLTGIDVLAIATHGLLASEAGDIGQPGLVFTPPGSPTMQDDGYLTAEEIAALRIEAGWVILSACNTAGGSGEPGADGLSGLGRAFIFAGTRNLLVSHWPVLDSVAADLTVRAVSLSHSDRSLGRAEALRQAMRHVRNIADYDDGPLPWSHPRVWAPFSLVGEGG